MPLEPVASVKSKYDLTRSWFHRRDSYPLVAGTNLVEEGQLMIAGGTTVTEATVSAGAADEVPLGVSLNARILGATFTAYEALTVPAAPGPYVVQLGHTNLVVNAGTGFAEALVYLTAGPGAPATLVVAGAAVAATSVTLNALTGVVTFAAGDFGSVGYIHYRWNLTVIESREILRQSAIGRGSDGTFQKIIVGRGENCVIYTSTFDCRGDWTLNLQNGLVNSPCLGAGGIWTTVVLNATGTPLGRVISLPGPDDPYLGIEFSVQ